jgi:hypothetical protein
MTTATAALAAARSAAAQKAWATIRARKAAALASTAVAPVAPVAIEVPAAIVNVSTDATLVTLPVAPSPLWVAAPEFVACSMYVDDVAVGCGWHRFVVVETNDRCVRLFHPTRLVTVIVSRKSFDKHAKIDRHQRKAAKAITSIVRGNLAVVDRANDAAMAPVLSDGGETTRRVLALAA